MELDLAGKNALVTGSSRGIGLSIARVLLAEGCKVALNGRSKDDVVLAAEKVGAAVAVIGDVTKPDEARRVAREAKGALGAIDILVCNVGSGRSVVPGDETFEEWQKVFATNLWSATNTIEAARPSLAEVGGVIVCISSICGHEVVPGAPVTYSVAKAALNAYVRGIARPLGKLGVRINAVAPGNILFDGSVWQKKMDADGDAVCSMLDRDVPLGRLGKPEEIGELVAYLASPRSGFVTGQVWNIDGGQVHS